MDTISRDQPASESATQGPPHGVAHGVATEGGDRWRRVRVDPGAELMLGRGSMLRAFGLGFARPAKSTAAKAAVSDRRGEERHHHVECLAWVGWKRWRGFVMNDAVLVNLSRGGARVFLDQAPPRGRTLWLYLETPDHRAVVKAIVREARTTAQGQCALRVEFREPCPYALFEAAVCGLAAADPRQRLARPPRFAPPRPALALAPAPAPAHPRRHGRSILLG